MTTATQEQKLRILEKVGDIRMRLYAISNHTYNAQQYLAYGTNLRGIELAFKEIEKLRIATVGLLGTKDLLEKIVNEGDGNGGSSESSPIREG